MITSNVIHRVFRIKCGDSTGTAFAIDVDGRQYLVTAKHVTEELNPQEELKIFANGIWNDLPTKKIGDADGDIDISVCSTEKLLTPFGLDMPTGSNGLAYGQDAYFLGFPYGILSKFIFEGDGYHVPLVKKAIVSCLDGDVILLDGHNNPGFSGGPVVFKQSSSAKFRVAGVISGYKAMKEPVYLGNDVTPLIYQYNTGIIVAYDIQHAIDAIFRNPIGFEHPPNSAGQDGEGKPDPVSS